MWCFAREPRAPRDPAVGVGNDFADLFEIKDVVRDRSAADHARPRAGRLRAAVHLHQRRASPPGPGCEVSPPATRIEGDDLVWELELADDATWSVDITVPFSGHPRWVHADHRGFGETGGEEPREDDADGPLVRRAAHPADRLRPAAAHRSSRPRGTCWPCGSRPTLDGARRGPAGGRPAVVPDRLRPGHADHRVPVGLVSDRSWPRGALLELASLQGKECNDFKDEEPGRIMHEIRQGELTLLGLKPHSPYYGTSDATMLWLILLSEYWRWTGDNALVRRLAPNARAALAWIDRVRRPRRRRVRGVPDALAAGPGQPVLARLLGRRAVRRRPGAVPADRDLRAAGLRLRREAAAGRAGRRAAGRPRAGGAPAGRGRRSSRSGSTATSGSTSGAATTPSGSTATSARSTR